MRIDSLVRIALCALIAMNCVLGAGFAELDINIDDRVNLSYANLSAMDLAGAHLNQSDLQGCNLNGSNLDGAYLRSAWLMASHLNGSTL